MIFGNDKTLEATGSSKADKGSDIESHKKELVTAVESIFWKAEQKQQKSRKGSLNNPKPSDVSHKKKDGTNDTNIPSHNPSSTLADSTSDKNSKISR